MNVSENWGNERKFNPKLEKYEHEDLDKKKKNYKWRKLKFYAEVLTKDELEYEPDSLKSMLAAPWPVFKVTTIAQLYETVILSV